MVFIHDTLDLDGSLQSSTQKIESMYRHIAHVPRYRSGSIRYGLIAYHDRCAREEVDFTSEPSKIISTLQTSNNSTNSGLHSALKDASGWGWRSGADRVVILLAHDPSKRLGKLVHNLFNIISDTVSRF